MSQILKPVYKRFFLIIISITLIYISCSPHRELRKVDRAFYYWKSVLQISPFELAILDSLQVNRLYVKYFDVGWNDATAKPEPVAKLRVLNFNLPEKFIVVPTVFITNECIQKLDTSQTDRLATNINQLIQQLTETYHLHTAKEIQLDCDWTAATQKTYFDLLQKIKDHWKKTAVMISATIRLHQVKFMYKTGIPPADKGLLMCYNMGNLKNPATGNSILETAELEKYTGNLSSYPLPLDVALPLFEWKVLFRDNVYSGLLQNLDDSFLNAPSIRKNNEQYIFLKDTSINGYSFKKNDVLRKEESNYTEIMKAASLISKRLKNTSLTLSLYHLDSLILKKYKIDELEDIYSSMH